MSRTINTDPYEVQLNYGRSHWEVCSQRDLHVVSRMPFGGRGDSFSVLRFWKIPGLDRESSWTTEWRPK